MQQNIPQPYTQKMLHIIANHWISCCVYTAAKLNIADHLADGPRDINFLANVTSTHGPSLYRVLRALASEGIFRETEPETFALTTDAIGLLEDAPGTMKHFILAELGDFYAPWGQLLYSVQTGKPAFDHYYEMNLWAYYTGHETAGLNFMQAMTRLTQFSDKAIAEAYDFSAFQTIVDIGGGNGALLMHILRAVPDLQGIVFDEPYVAAKTQEHILESNMGSQCKAVGGDFFTAVPPGADAYIMKYILHDWQEQDALRLLKNCYQAMPKGSKLLAVDAVIPTGNTAHPGKLMDVNMLVVTGGRERTAAAFQQLFEQAGLRFNGIIPLSIPDVSIIEGEKVD